MFSKYIDPKYIEYRLKIYRPQYIIIYAKCIYFFKTGQHSLQILRKSTKKYEGDLGLGEAIILKKNTYLVGPFYKKYILSGAVLYYFCMRYILVDIF